MLSHFVYTLLFLQSLPVIMNNSKTCYYFQLFFFLIFIKLLMVIMYNIAGKSDNEFKLVDLLLSTFSNVTCFREPAVL